MGKSTQPSPLFGIAPPGKTFKKMDDKAVSFAVKADPVLRQSIRTTEKVFDIDPDSTPESRGPLLNTLLTRSYDATKSKKRRSLIAGKSTGSSLT